METQPMARRFEVYGTAGSAILVEPFEPGSLIRLCLADASERLHGRRATGPHSTPLSSGTLCFGTGSVAAYDCGPARTGPVARTRPAGPGDVVARRRNPCRLTILHFEGFLAEMSSRARPNTKNLQMLRRVITMKNFGIEFQKLGQMSFFDLPDPPLPGPRGDTDPHALFRRNQRHRTPWPDGRFWQPLPGPLRLSACERSRSRGQSRQRIRCRGYRLPRQSRGASGLAHR